MINEMSGSRFLLSGVGTQITIAALLLTSEKSLLARGTARVAGDAGAELDELAAIYEAKGVSPETAAQVVAELTAP